MHIIIIEIDLFWNSLTKLSSNPAGIWEPDSLFIMLLDIITLLRSLKAYSNRTQRYSYKIIFTKIRLC